MYENLSYLIKQIALGEDSVLELKAVVFTGNKIDGPHKNGMADELAAMANTVNGTIILGVDDKTRQIQGIPQGKLDIVEGWLRSICNDSIDPPLDCVIRKLIVPDEQGEEKTIWGIRLTQVATIFTANQN